MVPCPDAKFPEVRMVASQVDAAADLELCQSMVWSARSSTAAAAALRSELPAETCLVTTDEAEAPALRAAAPRDLFVLPSARSTPTTSLPSMSPGATITQIESPPDLKPPRPAQRGEVAERSEAGEGQSSDMAGAAGPADVDLAKLAAALGRARVEGGAS